ncbi:hypothetical protein CUREI_11750 (plasmid) [Corynebacterium ureicelerivorans]|uniref:Uncharacterized protein n=1 Tax=Corynebacterium ureicelerivorans TaxID=401472 RepID=A0A077HT57_9CORY|nr:hypothetical protein CUREI_03220 [Corynebacterium ureicelerivorans]AIL97842.1 hypothetical protein CUREI_11750 [Corynebacterium ureicelerivorans]
MPIYHQGRKVKDVFHQGRKVKEIWHMGRLIYAASRIRGFEGFIDQMDFRMAAASLTATTATVPVRSSKRSELHMVAGSDSALTVTQGGRRALRMEVRGGMVYAESTSPSGQRVILSAPWTGGMHAVALLTDLDGLTSYKVTLLIDGVQVATTVNSGGIFNSQDVFTPGYASVAATNTAAWGFRGGQADSPDWIAETLRPGFVSWRTVSPSIQLLVPGGEVSAWAYSGGQGGQGGGTDRAGKKGAPGNGAPVSGFTLDMLPNVTVGEGGKRGRGSSISSSGNVGVPGGPTTIGGWFTTATATTRPTPQAWGSTYTGTIPGEGGAGGSSGNKTASGYGGDGSSGEPGGLVIARRWP